MLAVFLLPIYPAIAVVRLTIPFVRLMFAGGNLTILFSLEDEIDFLSIYCVYVCKGGGWQNHQLPIAFTVYCKQLELVSYTYKQMTGIMCGAYLNK